MCFDKAPKSAYGPEHLDKQLFCKIGWECGNVLGDDSGRTPTP